MESHDAPPPYRSEPKRMALWQAPSLRTFVEEKRERLTEVAYNVCGIALRVSCSCSQTMNLARRMLVAQRGHVNAASLWASSRPFTLWARLTGDIAQSRAVS